MKKGILLLLLLCVVSGVFADNLYKITLAIKDGKTAIESTESLSGYAPQTYEGGSYRIKDKDGKVIGEGRFSYPTRTVMEKFHPNGSIEGSLVPFEGKIIVIALAADGGTTIDLLDPAGKPIGTAPLPQGGMQAIEDGGSFFLMYGWVFILTGLIIFLLFVVIGTIMLIKKFRQR